MKRIVSVIVPTYNSAATLEACLRSVRGQSYTPIELIVVDNHSTDITPAIAKKYADTLFTRGPERSAQRNYGAAKASGKYVAIIDSDMELSPQVIEQCIKAIEQPGCEAVIIPEESFGEGFWALCKHLERSFYVGLDWMEAARFFRRKEYLRLGGYDDSLVSGEDWELSERFRSIGTVGRIKDFIHHNEGHLKLHKLLRKEIYYASKINAYREKAQGSQAVAHQMSPFRRYALFFSQPKVLFRRPIVGLGMLFMKTCEFGAGAIGHIVFRRKN